MDDLIKRADVVEMLWKIGFDDDPEALIKATLEMPSAKAVPENIEETFERMAFKLAEEREILIEGIKRMVDACEFCEFVEERPECDYADYDCLVCGCKDCVCRKCGNNSNFIFSPERAKKSLERFEGK
jgi:hypothetical protein